MIKISQREENIYKKFNFPDKEALHVVVRDEKTKKMGSLGSLIGVSLGLCASIALERKGQPIKDVFIKGNIKKSLKNFADYTKIDYEGLKGYTYMLLQAFGASIGSLLAGSAKDKDKKNREEKLKEAVFVMNNVAIPTGFAKCVEHFLKKDSKFTQRGLLKTISNNKLLKHIAIIGGLVAGLATSLSVTNTINTKIIEPDDKTKKSIKPQDFLAHADDLIPILASSKDSFLAGLPLDRTMPLIYFILASKIGKRNNYSEE